MKKSKMKNRLLFMSCIVGGMILGGCKDGDYNISSVDAKLGVGNGNLTLPSNNSFVITLDDILDLGSTDLITVNETTGEYMFGKDPESVSDVKVKVDKFTPQTPTETGLSFNINLPTFPPAIVGQEVDIPYTGITPAIDIDEQSGNISLLKYEFDAPDEIKSLTSVGVGDEGVGVNLNVSLTFPSEAKKFQYVKIEMPKMLTMTCNKSGFDPATNVLTLNNCTPTDCSGIVFNVTKINMQTVDAQNYAKLEGGKFKLESTVKTTLKISRLKVPSGSSIAISGNASFTGLTITSATGQFKPTINAQEVGSTTINSLPAFLTDKRVVADVDNPQIWLTIQSNIPLGGYVEAKLSSSTYTAGVILSKAKGNQLPIAANSTTKLVICRKAPAVLSGFTPVLAPDLSKLIEKLEEGMKINIDITKYEAEQTADVNVKLGHDYSIAPNYSFKAPLALGTNAEIVYKENEGDWNKDLKDLQLTPASKVVLTASVNNGVPANLEINVKPLDVNGNELTTLIVNPIKKTVRSGETADVIQYEISDPQGAGLNQLNGIEYELLVKAPSAATEVGKSLNKTQKITITTTNLQLNGKVIIDAN